MKNPNFSGHLRPRNNASSTCARTQVERRHVTLARGFDIKKPMTIEEKTLRGEPLAEELRSILSDRIRSIGLAEIAGSTGLSRNSLVRALSGLPVLIGTRTILKAWAAREAATPSRSAGSEVKTA